MKVKLSVSIIFFFVTGIVNVFSQTYNRPNVALKSHETLEILKIETTPGKTVVSLMIENRIDGGTFCADRNIFIIDANGVKLKLEKSSGIPVCPQTYRFRSIGETLHFTLDFPPLKSGIKWIDIVEDCTENCFSFYGVTLNIELNKKIDEALSLAEKGETKKAINFYIRILESLADIDQGVKAALYTDIITLSIEIGDRAGAEEWYKKMVNSKAPRLELYVENLNSRGIKY